jgi:hypothetical protein
MSTSNFYTPTQALGIAISFSVVDVGANILGLAWNGRFFTFDNIAHWFDFQQYSFTMNPVDFLASYNTKYELAYTLLGRLYNSSLSAAWWSFGRLFESEKCG